MPLLSKSIEQDKAYLHICMQEMQQIHPARRSQEGLKMPNMLTTNCRLCGKFEQIDPFTMLCYCCYLDYYGFEAKKKNKHLNSNNAISKKKHR
jgi:hypothetical protein